MPGALSNRYARALVEVVTKLGAAVNSEQARDELASFAAALHASAGLRNVLVSPAVAPDKKKSIIAALGSRLGLSAIIQNFLRVVVDHRRLPLLDEMIAAFEKQLDEQMGIVRAQVSSPQPVDRDQQSALESRLSQVTGKRVRLEFAVDPEVLGGVVARIDSTIYDGSVRGQLHAIGRRLATE